MQRSFRDLARKQWRRPRPGSADLIGWRPGADVCHSDGSRQPRLATPRAAGQGSRHGDPGSPDEVIVHGPAAGPPGRHDHSWHRPGRRVDDGTGRPSVGQVVHRVRDGHPRQDWPEGPARQEKPAAAASAAETNYVAALRPSGTEGCRISLEKP